MKRMIVTLIGIAIASIVLGVFMERGILFNVCVITSGLFADYLYDRVTKKKY